MMIKDIVGLLVQPRTQWHNIADRAEFSLLGSFFYTATLSLLPAVAWYYGTTVVGWTVGDGDSVKLTTDSAAIIITLFYLTMVACVAAIGYMMHWMSETYIAASGTHSSIAKCVAIAGYTATPLFIAGLIGFVPLMWPSLILALLASALSVYLLYIGLPIVMGISQERGFLYASAVIAFCLVIVTVIMGGSVIAWDMGAAPSFTD